MNPFRQDCKNPRLTYLIIVLFVFLTQFLLAGEKDQPTDQIYLIVRGDDIGSCHAANLACIQAYQNGIERTVEVMVPCPWFPEAVKLLNENPGLDVGIHLTLTSEWTNYKWGPLTCSPSLVDENGYFHPRQKDWANPNATNAFWNAKPKMEEVEQELRAQIETALKKIPQISHLSGHMGLASVDAQMDSLIQKLTREYDLAIDLRQFGVKPIRGFGYQQSPPAEREAALVDTLKNLKPGIYLLVEHPGLDTPEMQAIGHVGYEHVAHDRNGVTHALTSPKVLEVVRERNIQLISYRDLKEGKISVREKISTEK